jgi:hypothetical protein
MSAGSRFEKRFPRAAACALSLFVVACASTAGGSSPGRPAPAVFRLDVAGNADSVLKMTKFALAGIDGTMQLPQVRSSMTSVSTHYTRSRRGGGQTQVAIIVAFERHAADSLKPTTMVEVSGWAMDMAQQATAGQRRSNFPSTALSTNAPGNRQPRAITSADTLDYLAMTSVVEAFVARGAALRP